MKSPNALERDKLYLKLTPELGLDFSYIGKTFEDSERPKRYVGVSPCFQREAGSAGRIVCPRHIGYVEMPDQLKQFILIIDRRYGFESKL